MKIQVTDETGEIRDVPATPGMKALEAIQDARISILAQCGGSCACATCHVYVANEWIAKLPEPTEDEAAMLDGAFDVTEASRLACQIVLTEELDGLPLTLAPGSY